MLEAVERLIVAQSNGERTEIEHVAVHSMDTEERRLGPQRLNGNERRPTLRSYGRRIGADFRSGRQFAANELGEGGNGRVFEEGGERKLHPESFFHPREDADRDQRVAAEVEEVVVDAHAVDAEEVLPGISEHLLCRVARGLELLSCLRPCLAGSAARQGPAVPRFSLRH